MINELLAPAGSLEAVKTAIDFGADAVYCSGIRYGARSLIKNLTNEEIIEAAQYVHLYGKRIYITVNTFINEDEFDTIKEYIDFLYHHVDAIIVQDLGVFHYVRLTYPDFPVHISTQCNIHNVQDIRLLKNAGASRIVLAREVDIDHIKEFNKEGIELEIFIHGALCFSFSGMCYLSYYHGGRSGNRGLCAQPCRKEYELYEDDKLIYQGPLLSMKDLNIINKINDLLEVGVTSLKIEGRAKSIEYLASVVRIYREIIDAFNEKRKPLITSEMLMDLYASYSRERTNGYLFKDNNSLLTTDKSVKHQGVLIGEVIEYKNKQIKIKLSNRLDLLDGIRIVNDKFETGLVVTRIIEKGQLVKSSNTICIIDVKDKIFIGTKVYKTSSNHIAKLIKEMKPSFKNQAALDIKLMQNKLIVDINIDNNHFKKVIINNFEKAKTIKDEDIIRQFRKTNNLPIEYINVNYSNTDNYFLPITLINQVRSVLLKEIENYLKSRLIREKIDYIYSDNNYVLEKQTDELVLLEDKDYQFNLINFDELKPATIAFHLAELTSDSINSPYIGVNNHYAVSFLRNLTKGVIITSYELDLSNAERIGKYDKNIGYLINYIEPLMVARHCPINKIKGYNKMNCLECTRHQYYLKEYQEKYPLKFSRCIMRIMGKEIKRNINTDLIKVTLK